MNAELSPAIPKILKDAAANNIFFADDEYRPHSGFFWTARIVYPWRNRCGREVAQDGEFPPPQVRLLRFR